MAGKTIPSLLVTANVGSIFEDPTVMLKIWTEEFLQTVSRLDPKFIAVHCQEVGGKNYERSMKHVEYFVRLLMNSEELRLFDKVRVYLDEDFSSAENFTALGNLYFIHESLTNVLIWDFVAMSFVPATGKEVHDGNIEAVTTKEKAKFPQECFPECKWSRKGFLRTRWNLDGTIFDLINIHLFHDASNFVAMEMFPSVYCNNRRRALEHTLDRFHTDSFGTAPFFVFGDFNFRTDTKGVVGKLSEGLQETRLQSHKTDHTKMQYQDESNQVILSLGKKEFSHQNHQVMFEGETGKWLKEFDRELESFKGRLFEFPISFGPSYPFEENENGAKNYMKTRCPSWCDRVVLSNTATYLVNNMNDESGIEYSVMGANTCMGDHKPVYLKLSLITDAGTVPCCLPPLFACLNGLSRSPVLDTLTLPRASFVHDEPYTPESMDTPSPLPSPIPNDLREAHKSFNNSVSARLQQNIQSPFDFSTSKSDDIFGDKTSPRVLVTQHAQVEATSLIKKPQSWMDWDIPESSLHDGKPFDELMKRKQSQSAVDVKFSGIDNMIDDHTVPSLRTNRCFSDASWLKRVNKPLTRVRLISESNSSSRIESHHSSSDEDWFEECGENDAMHGVMHSTNDINKKIATTYASQDLIVLSSATKFHSSLSYGIAAVDSSPKIPAKLSEESILIIGSEDSSLEVVRLFKKESQAINSSVSQDCGDEMARMYLNNNERRTMADVESNDTIGSCSLHDRQSEESSFKKRCLKCGRCNLI